MKHIFFAAAMSVLVASSANAATFDSFLGVFGSGAEGQKFASSVALSGDSFIVGSTNAATGGTVESYDAGNGLLQWATLGSGQFGSSVALSGDQALVGAPPGPGDPPGTGSVSILDANTGAIVATTLDPSPADDKALGTSVALGAGLAFVGAPSLGPDAGNVYTYDDAGQLRWATTADGFLPGDKFGTSVSEDDGRLLVGAARDGNVATSSGSVHLLDALTGQIIRSIYNPEPVGDRIFGSSVAISGDHALVAAAPGLPGGSGGALYMFDLITGNLLWITGGTFFGGDLFGSALAFDGTYALAGAAANAGNPASAGSAYLLDAMTGEILQTILNPDAASGDLFGSSVSLFGNKALIGAERNFEANGSRGSAWLYTMAPVTPVPLPATLPLLAGTIACFAFLRRRARPNRN